MGTRGHSAGAPGANLAAFLASEYREAIEGLLRSPRGDGHHGVDVNFQDLAHCSSRLAWELLIDAAEVLDALDGAIVAAQERCMSDGHDSPNSVKTRVHARVHSVPGDPGCEHHPSLPSIGTTHVGKLITATGTVVRSAGVQLFAAYHHFHCASCHEVMSVKAQLNTPLAAAVPVPARCPSCNGADVRPVAGDAHTEYTDYHEVHLQGKGAAADPSRLPRGFAVLLMNDLAHACAVGDAVEVTGHVLQQLQSKLAPGAVPKMRVALLACHCRVLSTCAPLPTLADSPSGHCKEFVHVWQAHANAPLELRNRIVDSVCPQLSGMFDAKLAVLLALLGGVPAGSTRGDVHLLLVGDPGMGKSQLLTFASKLAARAVCTTGHGTSRAGLTAAAVKEGGQWALHAGAMVLADGGVCCIDEFGEVPAGEQCALHEAMEQQTVSVAKAGLVSTLRARASVLAAMNPVGRYDPHKSLGANTNLPGPLLSRFDLVMLLLDKFNPGRDAAVADHVLAFTPSKSAQGTASSQHSAPGSGATGSGNSVWSIHKLKQYIAWAKQSFRPPLTADAQTVLQAYYHRQRQASQSSPSGAAEPSLITVRFLEGLVRLSQAHARLMAHPEVLVSDAAMAVLLLDASMRVSSVLHLSHTLEPHSACRMDDKAQAKNVHMLLAALDVEVDSTFKLCAGDEVDGDSGCWPSPSSRRTGIRADSPIRGPSTLLSGYGTDTVCRGWESGVEQGESSVAPTASLFGADPAPAKSALALSQCLTAAHQGVRECVADDDEEIDIGCLDQVL